MLFFVNNLGYPSMGKFVRIWGIVQNSVQSSNVVLLETAFQVQIDWDTNDATPSAGDLVLFYRSETGGTAISPDTMVKTLSNNGRHQQVVCTVTPCQTGPWWFEVKSAVSSTTAKSYRTSSTKFKVLACML